MSASERNLLTRQELTEMLAIKQTTFYKLMKENKIPFIVVGNIKRYPKDQVQNVLGCKL